MNPPLRPKLAGSLILTRPAGGSVEILMGRRSAKHAFMPDRYVFPGGRADRADAYAPLAADLPRPVLGCMTKTMPENRARAVAVASVRETAEETGYLLASPAEIRSRNAAWSPFRQHGVAPDLSPLRLVARAITPPGRVRRFDAWFFHADASALREERVEITDPELEDILWVPFEKTGDLPLPHVTRFVLHELDRQLKDAKAQPRHIRELARKVRIDPL